jgi:THO complex subunit 4
VPLVDVDRPADAERAVYFPGGEANAASGAEVAQVTAGGDTAMDDEML